MCCVNVALVPVVFIRPDVALRLSVIGPRGILYGLATAVGLFKNALRGCLK